MLIKKYFSRKHIRFFERSAFCTVHKGHVVSSDLIFTCVMKYSPLVLKLLADTRE